MFLLIKKRSKYECKEIGNTYHGEDNSKTKNKKHHMTSKIRLSISINNQKLYLILSLTPIDISEIRHSLSHLN